MSLETVTNELRLVEALLESALREARLVHRSIHIHYENDGPAHPAIAMMELGVRSAAQSNDAVRWARHAMHFDYSQQQPRKEGGG